MSKYAYVRVSTKAQNEEKQLIALGRFDVPRKNRIIEKQSGRILTDQSTRELFEG